MKDSKRAHEMTSEPLQRRAALPSYNFFFPGVPRYLSKSFLQSGTATRKSAKNPKTLNSKAKF